VPRAPTAALTANPKKQRPETIATAALLPPLSRNVAYGARMFDLTVWDGRGPEVESRLLEFVGSTKAPGAFATTWYTA